MNLSAVPQQNEKVSLDVYDSLGYLVDPKAGKIRVVNTTGLEIWNAINGINSILDIINEIKNTYEDISQAIHTEVMHFLLQLKERSLIYLKEE